MSRKRTPDQESPETTQVAEPPAAEAKPDGQSFAERVGPKKRVPDPDPFPLITDTAASVRLFRSNRDRQMAIMFGNGSPQDKPSQPVIDKLKEAGYHWNSSDRIWALSFSPESALRTHIEAERLFGEISRMSRKEKGIETGQEVPF